MRTRARTRVILAIVMALALSLVSLPVAAAPGGGNGGGGGGNSGSGGGGGGGGGTGDGGAGSGGDFSELLLLYRDVNGVPITTEEFVGEHGSEYCVQPISYQPIPHPYFLLDGTGPEDVPTTRNLVDGREVTLVPLFAHFPEFLPDEGVDETPDDGHSGGGGGGGGGRGGGRTSTDDTIVPMHQPGDDDDHVVEGGEPCDPLVIRLSDDSLYSYAGFATEVELERLNLARSPEHVLLQHMKEIEELFLTTPPELVTLDTSGRPVFDGLGIDAGPKLQGIRESLLEKGTVPGARVAGYPFPFQLMSHFAGLGQIGRDFASWDAWELSSFAIGGAASKFTPITIDAVSYHDRIMGIPADLSVSSPWPEKTNYSEELGEYFVDYSGFSYDRAATFPGCATYMDPVDGQLVVVEYLDALYPDGSGAPLFKDLPPNAAGGPLANIAGYAQMAEDARSMNYFTHMFSSLYLRAADPVGIDTCLAQRDALTGVSAGEGVAEIAGEASLEQGSVESAPVEPIRGTVGFTHHFDLDAAAEEVDTSTLGVTFTVAVDGQETAPVTPSALYEDLAIDTTVEVIEVEVAGLAETCTPTTDLSAASWTVTELDPAGTIALATVVTCAADLEPDPPEPEVTVSPDAEVATLPGKGRSNGRGG